MPSVGCDSEIVEAWERRTGKLADVPCPRCGDVTAGTRWVKWSGICAMCFGGDMPEPQPVFGNVWCSKCNAEVGAVPKDVPRLNPKHPKRYLMVCNRCGNAGIAGMLWTAGPRAPKLSPR